MSDGVALALIAAIAPTLASVAALMVSVRSAGKLVQIHTLTNDNLSKVTSALAVSQEKVAGLVKAEAVAKENK